MQNPRYLAIHQAFALLAAFAMSIAWLMPYHALPWTSFYNELCMAIGLVLMALALLPIREPCGLPGVAWVLLAVAVIPWLQWLSGLVTFSGDAWVSSLYLLGFASAVAIGYEWHRATDKSLGLLLASATVVAASVSSAIGIDQTLNGGVSGIWTLSGDVGMPALGNLGQPNNLATLIVFGALGLFLLYERKLLGAVSSSLLLLLMVLGLAYTGSRTAILYGPIIAIGLWLFSKRNPGLIRTRPRTVVVATALHWLIGVGLPYFQMILFQSGPSRTITNRGLETTRYQAWQMFFGSLSETRWFGYGWLGTGTAQYAIADKVPPLGELYFQAHNLFIDLLVWSGYPLGILLSGLIVYWYCSRALRVARVEGKDQIAAVCGMLCLTVLGVHSMLELPYQYAYFLIPAGLWIGVIEQSVQSPSIGSPKWSVITATASVALSIGVACSYVLIEPAFGPSAFKSEPVAAQRAEQTSLASSLSFLSGLTALSNALRTPPRVGMDERELTELRAVVQRYPYSYNLLNFSIALAINGRVNEAIEVMAKIRFIHGETRYQSVRSYLRELLAQVRDSPIKSGLTALESSLPK